MTVGQRLQQRDVLLGTLFFSRLLLYIVWDKLDVLNYKRLVTQQIEEVVASFSSFSPLFLGIVDLVPRVTGLGLHLLLCHFFGTSEVWGGMADVLDHKLVCGLGGGQQGLTRVRIDHACLQLDSGGGDIKGFKVLTQSEECYQCPLEVTWTYPHITSLNISDYSTEDASLNTSHNSFMVNTRYPTLLEVEGPENTTVCSTSSHFEQFGVYQLSLDTCQVSQIRRPINAFLPIFWAFVIMCLLAGLRLGIQSVYNTAVFRRFLVWSQLRGGRGSEAGLDSLETPLVSESEEQVVRKSRRVKSLDTFRGLAITVMIFVNYGGGSYYFFSHSVWNGLTVADLVFPWFMWIMGVSLAISTQSQLRNSTPRSRLISRVMKRSIILVLLGLILNTHGNNNLRTLRIPGVLQRFGVSYLVVGVVESMLLPREYPPADQVGAWQDITSSPIQLVATMLLMMLHAIISLYLPVSGCPTGYLGPGGLGNNATSPNCTGGAARWLDVAVWGEQHFYQHPTSKQLYGGVAHDPEGLLGCLTSIAIVWLGVAAGRVILVFRDWKGRTFRWLVWAVVCGLIAACLAGFSQNTGIIPINKNLWSVSFVLATGGMAFFLLSCMYLLIDVYRFWSGSPLYYPGMNSLLLYLGHEMVEHMFPWSWAHFTNSHAELLAMNMWGTALWVLTSYVLFRKRIFLAL